MHAAHRRFLIVALAAALGLTALAVRAGAATTVDTTWYWSEYGAAHALYVNGITWKSGVDRMGQTHCWGLGHWLVDSAGGRHFAHFYCTATPARGQPYDVVMNVTGPSLYAISFVAMVKPQTWYWPSQYTANAIYRNGVRWLNALDPVTYDACSPFGASLDNRGVDYQHFYCSVHTTTRSPYTVVVNVTDKLSYTVKWVAFDDQLPSTPAAPTPAVAQGATSSASGGSTTTPPSTTSSGADPDCDMYCNLLRLAGTKTPPQSASSNRIVERMLADAALRQSEINLIKSQWQGNGLEVPNGAAVETGEVGCRDYSHPQSTAWTSVTACG